MAYKDKDKQREANRQAQAKFKAKAKGITEGITNQGITPEGITTAIEGQRQAREGYGSPTSADIHNKTIGKPKRGKDIKCFEDLHPEIQATIDRVSKDKDGKIDEAEKSRRTAIAVQYQHLYPGKYEPHSDLRFTSFYDSICTPGAETRENTGNGS